MDHGSSTLPPRGASTRRAVTTALRFLEACQRELPALVDTFRTSGCAPMSRELDSLVDGLESLATLAVQRFGSGDDERDGGRTPHAVGELLRTLRDLHEARADEDGSERIARLLDERVLPHLVAWRHFFESTLERLDHESH